jgi:hypothetical protein
MQCHWGYREGIATPRITYTISSQNNTGNAAIYDGSDTFKADQMVIKTPPFAHARIEIKPNHVTLRYDGDWVQLGLRTLREHDLVFQLGGTLIEAPATTSWWYPYDLGAIMRDGNSLNSDIPADPNEAEFPPEQWPQRIVTRIKAAPTPNVPLAPLPAGDPSLAPGLPKTWADVDPGNPRSISSTSAGLVDYETAHEVRPADDGIPIDESLAAYRGLTQKDEAVHKLISWTTRKDYPTHIGISLEIPDWVGSETHEIQFWEHARSVPWIGSARELYMWFAKTLTNRSKTGKLPTGMPPLFEGIEVTTERTGKNGRILFSLETSMGSPMISVPNMVQIEYGEGYARIGMGDSYTITMLKNEFCALIGDDWGLYPQPEYRRLTDGTVRHHTARNFDEMKNAIMYSIGFEPLEKIQEDAGR